MSEEKEPNEVPTEPGFYFVRGGRQDADKWTSVVEVRHKPCCECGAGKSIAIGFPSYGSQSGGDIRGEITSPRELIFGPKIDMRGRMDASQYDTGMSMAEEVHDYFGGQIGPAELGGKNVIENGLLMLARRIDRTREDIRQLFAAK